VLIKKLQDDNEELKGSIAWVKSHDEKLLDLRQNVEIRETTERKWTHALFFHNKE